MCQRNGVYATLQPRSRAGRHVFQGRYKTILVERDSYLLELARYVVLNPLRAKMVKGRREKRSARRGLGPFRRMMTVENVESSNACCHRYRVPDRTYFFTVNMLERKSRLLANEHRRPHKKLPVNRFCALKILYAASPCPRPHVFQ